MDFKVSRPQEGYFQSFDGLRAIAVFLVVINHMVIPLPESLEFIRSRGHLGVEVFFAISGFLVMRSLHVSAYKHRQAGRLKTLKEFFVRRGARIIFPYYLTLGGVFVLSLVVDSLKEKLLSISNILPSFFFYFYNYAKNFTEGHVPGALNIMWSLSFEEQFYILLGLIFCFGTRKIEQKLFAVCLLSLGARFYNTLGEDSLGFARLQFETHWRLDAILFGCLLYTHRDFCIQLLRKFRAGKPLILMGATVAFYYGDIANKSDFQIAFAFLLTSVFFTLLLLILIENEADFLSQFLKKKFLVFVGKISYEIYLVHQLINALLVKVGLQTSPTLYIFLLFSLSIILAGGFYRWISLPLQNRIRTALLPCQAH